MNKAFVLGAGLGTRLRPLTDQLPKPLIPVFRRPLITYAFDHLMTSGVREFIVNTHHLPAKYTDAFPGSVYNGAPITFRHETVLLETAGGIANIADLVRDEDFIVYNGDILTDLPLAPLMRAHRDNANIVTLALRSRGPGLHIALNKAHGRVIDIRGKLGSGREGTHQFTGIYIVSPAFLGHLTSGKIESVIPIFLKLISDGAHIGAAVIDEGRWSDLGDRKNYLDAHRELITTLGQGGPVPHSARIHPTARILGCTVVDDGCEVGANAVLQDSILWPGASVAAGARLERCIVRGGMTAQGVLIDADV